MTEPEQVLPTVHPEGTPIKYIPIDEFSQIGFLHEVNRMVLHPCGLALEWSSGWTREAFEKKMAEKGFIYGEDAMSNAWAAVGVLGLDKPHLGGVWDDRDDPEGILYVGEVFDTAKIARVQAEEQRHVAARKALFGNGYSVQVERYDMPAKEDD